jgi:hypothetical protein
MISRSCCTRSARRRCSPPNLTRLLQFESLKRSDGSGSPQWGSSELLKL